MKIKAKIRKKIARNIMIMKTQLKHLIAMNRIEANRKIRIWIVI
jgi:hypothetical protein